MKISSTIVFLFLTSFFSYQLHAQKTVWFDADWAITSKNDAVYYRPHPQKVKGGYLLIDYYLNGNIKRKGISTVPYPNEEYYVGVVKTYFDTGELQTRVRYTEGKRDGSWKEFYKSGKIKERGKYRNGEKVGIWKTFYKNVYK